MLHVYQRGLQRCLHLSGACVSETTQWLDGVVGAVGIGHFFIWLIMASNLGKAKSIAPCEATEPG